jgi:NAD(P)-dependent dehydrogenase (short-subunit alcohol dehydrogenase family)
LLVQQQRGHNLNTNRFQDMVVLVTGGNSGIGRATALAFAAEGARVIVAARRENLGAEVVGTIKDRGGEAVFVKTDVTSPSDIENLFKVISERYGGLDCAFNNAGRGARAQRLINITMDDWNAVMSTNLRSVWLCMKYEIPMMVKQGGGTIVNCSSMAGIHHEEGMSLVSASKNGVLGLTRAAEPTWNSSMSLGSRLLRFRMCGISGTISSLWVMALKTPLRPARPNGVRTPSIITASLIVSAPPWC